MFDCMIMRKDGTLLLAISVLVHMGFCSGFLLLLKAVSGLKFISCYVAC